MISIKAVESFSNEYWNIENFKEAAESEKIWHCHHKLETETSEGVPRPANARLSKEELKALDMYFDRPAKELIFLNHSNYLKLKKNKK